MEPNVLSSDTLQGTARSRRQLWLPGILLALVMLIALFAMGGAASAQEGIDDVQAEWAVEFCMNYGNMTCAMGDFNGDGRDDIVQFNRTASPKGDVYVRLSTGSGFEPAQRWLTTFGVSSGEITKVGDFNGDLKDDVILFTRGTSGEIWVALSNGHDAFGPNERWLTGFCAQGEVCDVGDYNGDGKDDVTAFTRHLYSTWGKVYVAFSNGARFNVTNDAQPWLTGFCGSWDPDKTSDDEDCGSGDFNGDDKDDIIAFSKTGAVWVALSTGSDFVDPGDNPWQVRDEGWNSKAFCWGNETCGVGDFNGDGKDDIITFLKSFYGGKVGWVQVALSNGTLFTMKGTGDTAGLWDPYFCLGSQQCGSGRFIAGDQPVTSDYSQVSRTGDFNGDCNDDVVAFLRYTEPTAKPGWVYAKLAYGSGFVDVIPAPAPPQGPNFVWLPLTSGGQRCR